MLKNRKQLEKAFNSALNSHRMSIIDKQQGLPYNKLPMKCALIEEGFSEKEATLVANCNTAKEAATTILKAGDSFSTLIMDVANEFYSLSCDAYHEVSQKEIREHVRNNTDVLSHPVFSKELTEFYLDEYFQ